MTISAVLRDGSEVGIAPECGKTVDEMVDRLTASSMTGGGNPLLDAKLTTTDGREILYADVQTFAEDTDFIGGAA